MKVFVYGTLRKGFGNHHFLEDSKKVADTFLGGYKMRSLGPFPAIHKVDDPTQTVVGEVYEIDDHTLQQLDMLEGVPHLYQRGNVNLGAGIGNVFVYTMRERDVLHCPLIESGNWEDSRVL